MNIDLSIGMLDPPLSDTIMQALKGARNISALYIHQVAAITALAQGKNVIVSTPTASGKSVIYQVAIHIPLTLKTKVDYISKVPLLRFLEDDHNAKAIFVYPTKVSYFFIQLISS
jgi:DEAD/DEAH box helicase domain-containing protein